MIIPIIQSPIWSKRYTTLRLAHDTVRFTEIGREIPCCICNEWLPADNEFFNLSPTKPSGLNSQCRVCSHIRWEK